MKGKIYGELYLTRVGKRSALNQAIAAHHLVKLSGTRSTIRLWEIISRSRFAADTQHHAFADRDRDHSRRR